MPFPYEAATMDGTVTDIEYESTNARLSNMADVLNSTEIGNLASVSMKRIVKIYRSDDFPVACFFRESFCN